MRQLEGITRWITFAVMILGVAGVAVSLVLHLPLLLSAVILLVILVAVMAVGAYRIWDETDHEKQTALAARVAATQELEAQRQAHEKALVAARPELSSGGGKQPPPVPDRERLRGLLGDGHALQLRIRDHVERGSEALPLDLREQVARWEGDVAGLLARKPTWLNNFQAPLIPLSSTPQPVLPREALARIKYQLDVLQAALRDW